MPRRKLKRLIDMTEADVVASAAAHGWRRDGDPYLRDGRPVVLWCTEAGDVAELDDVPALVEPHREVSIAHQVAFFTGRCPLCGAHARELSTDADVRSVEWSTCAVIRDAAGGPALAIPHAARCLATPTALGIVAAMGVS